jgi:hypothetical protein
VQAATAGMRKRRARIFFAGTFWPTTGMTLRANDFETKGKTKVFIMESLRQASEALKTVISDNVTIWFSKVGVCLQQLRRKSQVKGGAW